MRGNITRRGKESWRLKFEAERDPATGKRRIQLVTVRGRRKEAEAELTRLLSARDKGTLVDPSTLTLAEFLDQWERDWAATNLSPKTLERHKEVAHCHIRPHLGAAKLQKLRPANFVELYAALLREGRTVRDRPLEKGAAPVVRHVGLSPRTVGHVHRLLHRALGHAVKWGLLTVSPVAEGRVEAPPVEGTEIEILTEPQACDVLQKLRGKTIYPIIVLGLATGMRRGELLALRWKDVDLDGGKLRVEQSLEQTKAGLRFKAPKTSYGRRTIALGASVIAELRAHRKAQQEQRLALGQGKAPNDALVFATLDGAPRKPNSLTTEWRRLVRSLGLPLVSLHALRHTHASQLIASGMDVLTISRRLGHGSPTITLGVYGHLFSNTDDRAAAVVEAAFAKALSE